jgi:hypothetical protein
LKVAVALVLLALLVLVVFRWSDIADALGSDWPFWWLLLPLAATLLLVVLYVKERGPAFVRWPGMLIVSYLLPVVLAPFLFVYSLGAVYVTTPIFNRLGRIPPVG